MGNACTKGEDRGGGADDMAPGKQSTTSSMVTAKNTDTGRSTDTSATTHQQNMSVSSRYGSTDSPAITGSEAS